VLLVGPILVFAALGITAMALNSEVMQWLLGFETMGGILAAIGAVVPYVLVIAAFTFLYRFVPNARVRFGPALAAGIVGGVLWRTAGGRSPHSSPPRRSTRRSTRASRSSCCSSSGCT
jgi:membrane protein